MKHISQASLKLSGFVCLRCRHASIVCTCKKERRVLASAQLLNRYSITDIEKQEPYATKLSAVNFLVNVGKGV